MSGSRRIPSLDGVRALSIVLVIVGHWTEKHYSGTIGYTAGAFANLGVRIFFVLSGYLITRLLIDEQARSGAVSLREFYCRRAFRILPASLFFMLPVFYIYRHELTWYHGLAALVYVTNFDPSHPWFVGHLWSLSVEEQFYALWPAAFKYLKRPDSRMVVYLLLATIGFTPVFRVICHMAGTHGRWDATFFGVADILAVGCLLAIWESRGFWLPAAGWRPAAVQVTGTLRLNTWVRIATLIMLAVVFVVPFYYGHLHLHLTSLLLFVLFPLQHASIAGLLLQVSRKPYWLLNVRPVVWVGQISYSLYLWQQIFTFNPVPRSAAFALWAVVMACASYYLVEKPALRMRLQISRKAKPPKIMPALPTESQAIVA